MIKYAETFGNDNFMFDVKLEKKDFIYVLEVITTEYDLNQKQKSRKTEVKQYSSNNAAKNYIRRLKRRFL